MFPVTWKAGASHFIISDHVLHNGLRSFRLMSAQTATRGMKNNEEASPCANGLQSWATF